MKTKFPYSLVAPFVLLFVLVAALAGVSGQTPQDGEALGPTPFRVGEKLAYTITVGPFKNSGFAELAVVSRGKFRTRDAVELNSRLKFGELAGATLGTVDELRTAIVSAADGQLLTVRKTNNAGVVPVSVTTTYADAPTSDLDWLSFIYKLRFADGTGRYTLIENDAPVAISASPLAGERIKTDAGDFEVTNVGLQSGFFTDRGITDVVVALSTDDARIPVQIRFKSRKNLVRILLQSVQVIAPVTAPTPRPTATRTPTPNPTPTAKPTPAIQPDNQPLSSTLPFVLGETLEYRLTAGGKNVGTFVLRARERRTVDKRDTLFLSATATSAEPAVGLFGLNDSISAAVDAEGLAPYSFDVKINGSLGFLNQSVKFDQERGIATTAGGPTTIPINTHSLLSLVYAIRSFNLKPSKDDKNPVNDTRVSVFYDSKFYIFTLRPLEAGIVTLRGEKVTAQLITVVTGNPQLDALNLRVWLSNDERRVPLRFAIGGYQADLATESVVPPK